MIRLRPDRNSEAFSSRLDHLTYKNVEEMNEIVTHWIEIGVENHFNHRDAIAKKLSFFGALMGSIQQTHKSIIYALVVWSI